jgi:DNA-directed RNA polymerase subunit beta'
VGIIAAQSIGEPVTQFSIGAYKKGVRIAATKESEPTKIEDFFKSGKESACMLSEYEGRVKAVKDGKRRGEKVKRIIIINAAGKKEEHKVSLGKEIIVAEGDIVKYGDPLTAGVVNPYELLKLKGKIETAQFLIDNLQEFFKGQGSEVNRKHFETILSKMIYEYTMNGGLPVRGLRKINKLAKSSEGFLSNVSFEEAPKKLAEAALEGKIDYLKGIQENVMLGRLIPVGTGHPNYTGFKIRS